MRIETRAYRSWRGLNELYQKNRLSTWRNWIFRGMGDASYELESSLERELRRFRIPLSEAPLWEARLFREFKRHVHRMETDLPGASQLDEWWALMQHYGAPTRLLDWTYSFWVGLFFALEKARPGEVCAIWALDRDWLRRRSLQVLPQSARDLVEQAPKSGETMVEVFLRASEAMALPVNPLRLNERHALQQGLFIAPGDVRQSFMENLERAAEGEKSSNRLVKIEIQCSPKLLSRSLSDLHRMNVNRATLFPGLEGFANDLKNRLASKDFFRRVRFEPPFDHLSG